MDIEAIVKITSRAWSLTILALMHGGTPGRLAPLLAASGAGRTAFSQSLLHLVEIGLLERNPGHGHPLRPEFRLTPEGAMVAAVADKIEQAVSDPDQSAVLRRMWTVPVLAVSRKPKYFSEMRNELGMVTDRALSQTLLNLQERHWIHRAVDTSSRPPRPLYHAVNAGLAIGRAVQSENAYLR